MVLTYHQKSDVASVLCSHSDFTITWRRFVDRVIEPNGAAYATAVVNAGVAKPLKLYEWHSLPWSVHECHACLLSSVEALTIMPTCRMAAPARAWRWRLCCSGAARARLQTSRRACRPGHRSTRSRPSMRALTLHNTALGTDLGFAKLMHLEDFGILGYPVVSHQGWGRRRSMSQVEVLLRIAAKHKCAGCYLHWTFVGG